MCAKRGFLVLFVVFAVLSRVASTQEMQLKPGHVREVDLTPGQKQSFAFTLATGDFVQLALNPRGQVLIGRTYDPSGRLFRGATMGPAEGKFNLVANVPGTYRVDIAGKNPRATGTYSIALAKVVTLAARLAPLKPVVESLRIEALRKSLERGEQESLNWFWQEINKTGAPLIEPIAGDRENMAVTFVWKGTPYTHNVLVLWLPYLGVTPDEFFMTRLGDTDVWYKTIKVNRKMRLAYTLATNVGRLRPMSLGFDADAITMAATAARPDSLNPKRYRIDPGNVDAPEYSGQSVLEMPNAPAQPWITPQPGVAGGRVEKRRFKSTTLGNEREIAIYLPPGYTQHAEPYPLIVLFDEEEYLTLVPTPVILDNLISEGRIPPAVALLIGNAPGGRDRELVCNREFSRALVTELLPWAHGLYNFTSDPHLTVVAGSSAGGLAATCSALWHAESFGNVLAQSGAFHRTPPSSSDAIDSSSEPNWVTRQFISSPRKQLRFYLEAGSAEFNATGSPDSILFCTRTLRDVLRAKGYEVLFHEFEGGHDYLSWRGTLADGLIALLGEVESK
ncbi:MAG TPA: alpha/beta hydrolase-fold protein [Terriglobales bacterium]|nr:alpha/beta hydrolase-fold protein [Terriglobales bacterium]